MCGVLQYQKMQKKCLISRGTCPCHAPQKAHFWVIVVISGASQHPTCAFIRLFWSGTYGLGAIVPEEPQFLHLLLVARVHSAIIQCYS